MPRAHRKKKEKAKVFAIMKIGLLRIKSIWAPVKKTALKRLIKRILAYSATNKMAKPPLLYSTLKPDTSSDSPSAKSKGARFVSARIVISHITKKGKVKKINQTLFWEVPKKEKLYDRVKSTREKIINAIVTS